MAVDPPLVAVQGRLALFGLTPASKDQAALGLVQIFPTKLLDRHGTAGEFLALRRIRALNDLHQRQLGLFTALLTVRTPYRPKVSRRLRPLALRYCTRNDLAPLALTRRPNPGSSSSQKNSSPLAALAASTTLLVSFGISGKHRVSSSWKTGEISGNVRCPQIWLFLAYISARVIPRDFG